MKTKVLKSITIVGLFLFLIACSTKKNTFLARNSHALSTKYNILYNGGVALDKGIIDLKSQYKDNFWARLPIERMQINKEEPLPGQAPANPNFSKAETKAVKAIQKHSMNIEGIEKNPQMDDAYLTLGKARYYDQRFVPALEAFNYILYKYPFSNKIYEVKVWREKTNIRMDNNEMAIINLKKLLKEIKFKDQIFADANAILSQAFLNIEQKDSAIARLKLAKEYTKPKEERARYTFILGQLYEELGYKDSAFIAYQTVIDMKRKAPKPYVIHAEMKQAQQFDFEKGDTLVFLDRMNHLLKDRENRPFLDVLNHQFGLFYDHKKNYSQAEKQYKISLKTKSKDPYLVASNYRNLADIYFKRAKYPVAGQYYDSTLVQLDVKSREYKSIKKKRENLTDVIKYEGIASVNDSIIRVFSLSNSDKTAYFENYILKLKASEAAQKILKDKEEAKAKRIQANNQSGPANAGSGNPMSPNKSPFQPPSETNAMNTSQSVFYFYNPATLAYGKNEFRKIWGDRNLKDNWRISAIKTAIEDQKDQAVADTNAGELSKEDKSKVEKIDERYTTEFYINKLPKSITVIDSIAKERNFAYYQLGTIYKEKFKENKLAASKLEQLLLNKPEERLLLPTMYNLYKIYEQIDTEKALAMKNKIISQFPDSRYAQIVGNLKTKDTALSESPEGHYYQIYKLYENGDFRTVLSQLEVAIFQYAGESVLPKFELLKAITIGKLKGLEDFKKALNAVALNYPNQEEGKQAESMLKNDVPKLESLKFHLGKPLSWKILYKVGDISDPKTKILQDKILKLIKDREFNKVRISYDIYTMNENFIVIHGLKTEGFANEIATILKEYKEYKVTDLSYIISNDDYKIIQFKKNFEEFLITPLVSPAPVKDPNVSPSPILDKKLEEVPNQNASGNVHPPKAEPIIKKQ